MIFILPLRASWQKVVFCQCQKDKSMDACEYGEADVVEKYLWEEGMYRAYWSTEKSVFHKLFPAATEFG